MNDLDGKEWIKSTASVWFQRGLGKHHPDTHFEKLHPAPFPFIMVERLLSFFTKKGDLVLDPFLGVASTLKACALNGRRGVGIELITKWVELAKKRLDAETTNKSGQVIIEGDSRTEMKKLEPESFDFIVTSPPYWGILNKKPDHRVKTERVDQGLDTSYSDDENDLGNIEKYDEFLSELGRVLSECYRVLKPKKYMTIVVSDFRHKSKYYYFHSDVAKLMEEIGWIPKGLIVHVKNAKKLYPYGYPYDFVPNVLHEYLLIFKKDEKQ